MNARWMSSLRRSAVILVAALAVSSAADAQSIVLDWNKLMLSIVAQNPPAPTVTTWRLHIVSTAMYDAWAAYDAEAVGYYTGDSLDRPAAEHTEENQAAAVSHAAYHTLRALYPSQKSQVRALIRQLGYSGPFSSSDLTTPVGIGTSVAATVIAIRRQDGSNAAGGFAQITSERYPELYVPFNSADPRAPDAPGGPLFDPNHWQPLRVPNGTLTNDHGYPIFDNDDPSTFTDQNYLTAHWGAILPFALADGRQFRPPAPPQFGSAEPYRDALGQTMTNDEAWHRQNDEVLAISAGLTDEQKVIAEVWADGPQTWTPPGHWNQIAQGISIRDQHGIGDDVKMYFALNGALLDAGIACWDAKRAYDSTRPISAIRHVYHDQTIEAWGGPNRGTRSIQGRNWKPYQAATFLTPAFPEYVSGHSTFSRAAREVLRRFAGSDRLYDGQTLLGEDWDGDGVEDLMGQHIAVPGTLKNEVGPAETVVLRWPT
ncbi:MAG: vanadium-dependent haloperoxidase, partial [Thermoanaerobaculia bacterium]